MTKQGIFNYTFDLKVPFSNQWTDLYSLEIIFWSSLKFRFVYPYSILAQVPGVARGIKKNLILKKKLFLKKNVIKENIF